VTPKFLLFCTPLISSVLDYQYSICPRHKFTHKVHCPLY
jgi:hypothetical protein